MDEDIGRFLARHLETSFPNQLGKMTMTELKQDPHNLAKLNTILKECSTEYDWPINELQRKVSTKFYRSKQANILSDAGHARKKSSNSKPPTKKLRSALLKKAVRPARFRRKNTIRIDPAFKKNLEKKMKLCVRTCM